MSDHTLQQTYDSAVREHQAGRLREAEALYRQVLARQPNHANTFHMLGNLAFQVGQVPPALELIRHAIAINPGIPEYHKSLGQVLSVAGQPEESLAALHKAIALRPEYAEAYFHLGNTLQDQGKLAEAIVSYEQARRLEPDIPQVYSNLGVAYKRTGQQAKAIASFQRAVELWPEFAEAWNNLGGALQDDGQWSQAMEAVGRAMALRPDYPEAQTCLGLMLLLQGDYSKGWPLYESRRFAQRIGKKRTIDPKFPQPVWDGSDLAGKRILLCAEQGLGDTIHFVRYGPMVAARGGEVMLRCQPELRLLLEGRCGIGQIVTTGDPIPEFDVYSLLLSLPGIFQTTTQTIPAPIPYLYADTVLAGQWRRQLSKVSGRLKVGLVWAGGAYNTNDLNRSLRLEAMSALAHAADVQFISLQKGEASSQAKAPPAGMKLLDWTDQITDFADTAALVENLDLVITVDTAVAHLAGAMGKPAWVLLPFSPDWRWMLNRSDSPWYPTIRLFRQPRAGDWATVMRDVATALRAFESKQM